MRILVIGAGHAGVEAALASAKMGIETILLTMDPTKIAVMPCNPSIGGPAKGVVVREIDALGGQMGITADHTALQFKLLNTNKGPGVQCLRVQSDKVAYSRMMADSCPSHPQPNGEDGHGGKPSRPRRPRKRGPFFADEGDLLGDAVILTSGTYMSSKVLVGSTATASGPDGESHHQHPLRLFAGVGT
jgi:tRNA uridine 5-carboxymethylaminomethyl modification enzyme